MNRKCVCCKQDIIAPTPKTKYCNKCAGIKQREQRDEWLRVNRRRDYDLFCLDCNIPLPDTKGGRAYCNVCAGKRTLKRRSLYMKRQQMRIKLDNFYKNLRINLIQTPYLK